MAVVCVDTQIMIWGIKEQATAGQEEMIPKTKAFLEFLDSKGVRVLVPSVVVSELLMLVDPSLHSAFNNLIARSFLVAPFDQRAAAINAEIWQAHQQSRTIDELKASNGLTRNKLKADCMIVATAVAHQAYCIYSHDKGVLGLAAGYIEAKSIPTILTQLVLPTE